LGRFPLRHADDFAERLPAHWQERGGVLMPMFQAEALWINFRSLSGYPFALKIAAGKINAVSAEAWRAELHRRPAQDYVVIPGQPWLDGFAVRRGVIRQFVAMPLGAGYSVEEQLTGAADIGGIQLQAHPLRADVYFQETVAPRLPKTLADVLALLIPEPAVKFDSATACCAMAAPPCPAASAAPGMGLGAGGQMRQEIYADRRPLSDWDAALRRRCFVHLCNSLLWREITGAAPPQPPVTANEYTRAGLPWFDYYREDFRPLPGGKAFAKVRSIFQLGKKKGDVPLPSNEPIQTPHVVPVGPTKRRAGEVRAWRGD
ncbi:MAG: hypothetical protein JO295_10630, partial [Verrucomicrobia bacterium]|nr:hypothetical protein [Verrucomicrobiota bacterium]